MLSGYVIDLVVVELRVAVSQYVAEADDVAGMRYVLGEDMNRTAALA
jgi:hypothetical protein